MHAPPKPDYPIINPTELANFDGILLGIPTRYGNMPAQWKVRIYSLLLLASGWNLGWCFFFFLL
jgi:multimeric flavodoxin WrbA